MKINSSSPIICFLLLFSISNSETAPSGTIKRASKQQIIATLHPDAPASAPTRFLTSPSGKYAAFFLRTPTAPTAGGFGNDFCYIQIQDSESHQIMWESECTPVSTSNACTLVFSNDGLAIFDGSNSQWETDDAESADDNPLEILELVDEGDMRIRDKVGELAWKASDDPRVNQKCGEPGSPGLAPGLPPFAQPIGGGGNLPFGLQSNGESQRVGFGIDQQPLVDRGADQRGIRSWINGIAWGIFVCLVGYEFVF